MISKTEKLMALGTQILFNIFCIRFRNHEFQKVVILHNLLLIMF